jgi:hypothetical protein
MIPVFLSDALLFMGASLGLWRPRAVGRPLKVTGLSALESGEDGDSGFSIPLAIGLLVRWYEKNRKLRSR